MADIRDFKRNQFLLGGKSEEKKESRESNESKEQKDDISLHSRIKRHKVLMFYRICAVVAMIAVAVIVIFFRWKNVVYKDYEIKQQYDWEKSSEAKCISLQGMIVAYSKDGMSCTDSKGKIVWNQTYEMQSPMIRTCKNVVAIGDYNGRKIYISNTEGNLGSIDTTMPIRDFCVAANGVVAAVLDDTTVTAIYLYSATGELLASFKTTMSKSGYPISVAISDAGTQVAVSYLKAEDGQVSSSIGFYNFSSVGQNYTDNLVGGYGYANSVVPFVKFMNNDTVAAVADNRLMFFQGKQKPSNTKDIMITEEIQSVFSNESYIGLVFYNPTGETTYRMDVYDTTGEKKKELTFNTEYREVLFSTQGVVIYSETECLIYDWEGRLKYDGTFKEGIECVIPSTSISRYALVTDSSIQTIELN